MLHVLNGPVICWFCVSCQSWWRVVWW